MKRASVLWVLAILVQGCHEKEALFFAPMAAPTGRITVTVRVDGEAVVNQVSVIGAASQSTTPAAAIFDVAPGTYDVTATNPPGTVCVSLNQQVQIAAEQTFHVVFDCFGLAGQWEVNYGVIEQNCFQEPVEPFEVLASFVTDGNALNVVFPDAPDTIDGTYNPMTLIFTGTTERVPVPDVPGVSAQEAYDIMFLLNDGIPTFEGESLVTFEFEGVGECMILYQITGRRASE